MMKTFLKTIKLTALTLCSVVAVGVAMAGGVWVVVGTLAVLGCVIGVKEVVCG